MYEEKVEVDVADDDDDEDNLERGRRRQKLRGRERAAQDEFWTGYEGHSGDLLMYKGPKEKKNCCTKRISTTTEEGMVERGGWRR